MARTLGHLKYNFYMVEKSQLGATEKVGNCRDFLYIQNNKII